MGKKNNLTFVLVAYPSFPGVCVGCCVAVNVFVVHEEDERRSDFVTK